MSKKCTILVAPLDWGLGHVTRTIPIIKRLQAHGCSVIVAADGSRQALLEKECSDLQFVPIINYKITYGRSTFLLFLKFPFLIGRVFFCYFKENKMLKLIIKRYGIDGIISDQRFGCFSKKIPSVYISHQLVLKLPKGFSWLEPIIALGLRYAISNYTYLWIPDYPDTPNLTGYLTRKLPIPRNSRFIGPLSRFSSNDKPRAAGNNLKKTDLLIMLSGPEPQRTVFQQKVFTQLKDFSGNSVVLLGKPEGTAIKSDGNCQILPHASSEVIRELILTADAILCRGGYTTIMELISLRRSAILVPTPGQTEQEYLCSSLSQKGLFVVERQRSFDLKRALSNLATINNKSFIFNNNDLLAAPLKEFLKKSLPNNQGDSST